MAFNFDMGIQNTGKWVKVMSTSVLPGQTHFTHPKRILLETAMLTGGAT